MKDVHVYRGCDIGSDHYILIAEFKLWSKWRKLRTRQRVTQDEVYKVYLLQDESIKDLYQRRLEKYLLETTTEEVLEDEVQKVKNCIYKAADEVLGKKKKIRSKKSLRIWNEEIEKAIKEKQKAYLQWIQKKDEETRNNYKEKRNLSKVMVRKAHEQSWENVLAK